MYLLIQPLKAFLQAFSIFSEDASNLEIGEGSVTL